MYLPIFRLNGDREEAVMKRNSDDISFSSNDEEQHFFLSNGPVARLHQSSPFYRFLPWIINIFLLFIVTILLFHENHDSRQHRYRDQEVYSPAQDAIEYQTTVFSSSFGKSKTKYQGPPTDEVDKEWDELYNAVGISRIDEASAMQLPNKTVPIPGDPGYYIVGIDVFHQLHCLNNLRQLIWPERYHLLEQHMEDAAAYEEHINHLDHCVDFLRQAIMCHSDVSTLYWEWIPAHQRNLAHADTTHTCRNFDKIWQWAKEHELDGEFDGRIQVHEHGHGRGME